MANFYLGGTELNQTWLGSDSIGSTFQTIPSLFSVFPVANIKNYWNQLSASYFETAAGTPGGARVQKWYDSITNSYISSSDSYPISGQTPLDSDTLTGSTTATYIGIGDGGVNARVFLKGVGIQNNNFSAVSNDTPINLTGSFSVFFSVVQDIPTFPTSYNAVPISLSNNGFNRLNFVIDRDQPTGDVGVYFDWFGNVNPSGSTSTRFPIFEQSATTASINMNGWYGFTFDDNTKEVKVYYNSATPTLVTGSGTYNSPSLNFLFYKLDTFSANADPTTTQIVELTVLNKVPTQLEIENYNAWSKTTYSSLY
jgi:hypothetical protein